MVRSLAVISPESTQVATRAAVAAPGVDVEQRVRRSLAVVAQRKRGIRAAREGQAHRGGVRRFPRLAGLGCK